MMKYLFFALLLLSCNSANAQSKQPAYVDVVRTFCLKYTPLTDPENYTDIAKKKAGWYIRQVNRVRNDSVLFEQLFYSNTTNSYAELESYDAADNPDVDSMLERRLSFTSYWYQYHTIPYFGYKEWHTDVINDYGNKENLTDSELDGLARAYDHLALSYLWHQSGAADDNDDTLKRKLGRLEKPSLHRIEKVTTNLDKAIAVYEKLNQQNPYFQNIVGNSTLKLFNEYMHAYNQLMLCGEDEKALKYLHKTTLPEPYVTQATNYLNSCSRNAILITYGDNDTYQLWYAQEKYGYRKDVRVINYSLLGMPVYIQMLKRKNIVKLLIPDSFLKEEANDVAYFVESKAQAKTPKEVSLKEFLASIYTKKFPAYNDIYPCPTYPYSKAAVMLPGQPMKKITIEPGTQFCQLNDLVIYDIVVNNIATAPVYFTSPGGDNSFKKFLGIEGIVYRIAGTQSTSQKEKTIQSLQKFIEQQFVPVLSNSPKLISNDGDGSYLISYYTILKHYNDKNDIANLKKWLHKFDKDFDPRDVHQVQLGYAMIGFYLNAGEKKKAEALAVHYAAWLNDAYITPSPLNGFYSRKAYLDGLENLKATLISDGIDNNYIQKLINEVRE